MTNSGIFLFFDNLAKSTDIACKVYKAYISCVSKKVFASKFLRILYESKYAILSSKNTRVDIITKIMYRPTFDFNDSNKFDPTS